jgi:hypothetical protein
MGASMIRGMVLTVASFVAMAGVAAAQGGITKPKPGQGGSVVTGSAGTSGSTAPEGLERCDKPMGAVAVVEPQSEVITALLRYKLQSPVGLIRMMIQQSNCFIVVERGAGMQNMMQERQLASSGQLRQDSNVGGGQMVTADFVMTPSVVFSENNAGGVGGGVAGLVADARSGVQVAAAEGSTKKADLRLGAALFGGGMGAAGGGYGNTNEGKIIAAAFMDNYNQVVNVVRNDPSLQRNVGTLKAEAAAGGAKKAGAVYGEGDVVVPKIANVKLLAQPNDTAKALATLARGEELVVVGGEKDGFINVQTAAATGWVKVVLVTRQ